MKLTISIEAEVEYQETVDSILSILDNTLPYMTDNVIVQSHFEK